MPRKRVTKGPGFKEVKGFNAAAFYNALTQVVVARKVPWIKVSRETGISTSTLSRMAVGRGPDAASLAVLSAWAGLNPANFVRVPQNGSLGSLSAIPDTVGADSRPRPQGARKFAATDQFDYEAGRLSFAFDLTSETPSRSHLESARKETLREANFSLWANRSLWTVEEAAFLLLGYEPIAECEISSDNLPEGYSLLRRLLLRNAGANLRLLEGAPKRGPRFRARDVIKWARSRSLLVPQQLRGRIFSSAIEVSFDEAMI
jgi:hypothetical protein